MYGRSAAGVSWTTATHQPAETMSATPAAANWRIAASERRRSGHEIDQPDGGQNEQRLQHLGDESRTDEDGREDEPPSARPLQGPDCGVRSRRQQQHEEGVGIVVPEHQRRHRREGQDRARMQRGGR